MTTNETPPEKRKQYDCETELEHWVDYNYVIVLAPNPEKPMIGQYLSDIEAKEEADWDDF